VSRISNPQALELSFCDRIINPLPTGSRRYGRLEVRATVANQFQLGRFPCEGEGGETTNSFRMPKEWGDDFQLSHPVSARIIAITKYA
jgi:hypothetical protein